MSGALKRSGFMAAELILDDLSSEPARCALCGTSEAAARIFRKNGYNVMRCPTCTVQFLMPQPSDDALREIYSTMYFRSIRDPGFELRSNALKRQTAALYLDELRSFCRKSRARLLEIGCGEGQFLQEAQRRGMNVEGIEYSHSAAEVANTRIGRRAVRVGSIEDLDVAAGTYDVVAFSDLLEHVRDPRSFLKLVSRALVPGGIAFIVTPSLDSWSRKLLRKSWMEYKIEHLWYFNRRSITGLLHQCGFRIVAEKPNIKILSVDYISHHFERFPVPILSRIVTFLNGTLPKPLLRQPFRIVASGMLVLAQKC